MKRSDFAEKLLRVCEMTLVNYYYANSYNGKYLNNRPDLRD